jgi:hypothetical protein
VKINREDLSRSSETYRRVHRRCLEEKKILKMEREKDLEALEIDKKMFYTER